MWSLRQKVDGSFYLTYDKFRRHSYRLAGIWEHIGKIGSPGMEKIIEINRSAGYLCANDDEGGVRALVLEERDYV